MKDKVIYEKETASQLDLFHEPKRCSECPDFQSFTGCTLGYCLKRWPRKINRSIWSGSNCKEMEQRIRVDLEVTEQVKRMGK